MQKEIVIQKIKDAGLVVVVRTESSEQADRITEACIEGGAAAIELTFTVPMAYKIIEKLSAKYCGDQIIIGAGTVLDSETARMAILSGAQYIVSPGFNVDTVKLCNRYRVPALPGVMSITEALIALEYGVDILKIFPGEIFGPQIIKAFSGPLPQACFMPTGGVDVYNVAEWIKAGAVAVGVGGALTSFAKDGNYKTIVEQTKKFIENIRAARG